MKVTRLGKKILLTCVMAVMAVSFAGCGKLSAEDVIRKYTEKNLTVDNCEATMSLNMEMGSSDSSDTYQFRINSQLQLMKDPDYKAYMKMNMDMGSIGKYDMDTYIMKDGDQYYTYMYSANTWMKQALDNDVLSEQQDNMNNQLNMDIYIKNMKNFSLAGEETVEDKETFKIEGKITGDALKEVFEQSDVSSLVGTDADDVDFSSLGDLNVTIWIDKNEFTPVKIYADMAPMMESIMQMQGQKMTIPVCTMELVYQGFGTVTDITLPEDAKNAVSIDAIGGDD